jgi:signal peptidase II
MTLSPRLRWLWLTLVAVIFDRATKAWIESRPASFFPHVVVPNVFNVVSSRNPGIAFSFFANYPGSVTRVILIIGALLIIGVLAWLLVAVRDGSALNAAGLALLLGGAAGNITDRIVHGAVTDFLDVSLPFIPLHIFNPWPTFNVADAAITIGAVMIVFDVVFRRSKPVGS